MKPRLLALAHCGLVIPVLAGSTALAVRPGAAVSTREGRQTDKEEFALEKIVTPDEARFPELMRVRVDSLIEEQSRYSGLSDKDFELVATELGVEVAAIRAVVSIEAGNQMKGFFAPGVPVINFDNSMYSRFRHRASGGGVKGEKVPEGLSGYALREWTLLVNARKVNSNAANMGTFWGMFQIGGFNYSKCGCESIDEFVRLMSYSELEQLELFAAFITNTGMLDDLRKKNWAGFARKYNGASYKRRGYHTKMANAYNKFKNQEKQKRK